MSTFDIATLKGKMHGDALGVGLIGLYDKSGTGALQNITPLWAPVHSHEPGSTGATLAGLRTVEQCIDRS